MRQPTPTSPLPEASAHAPTLHHPAQCAIGMDMRNIERKGADQPLHPFIRVFRQGLGAVLGRADIKAELVGPGCMLCVCVFGVCVCVCACVCLRACLRLCVRV